MGNMIYVVRWVHGRRLSNTCTGVCYQMGARVYVIKTCKGVCYKMGACVHTSSHRAGMPCRPWTAPNNIPTQKQKNKKTKKQKIRNKKEKQKQNYRLRSTVVYNQYIIRRVYGYVM